MKDQGARQAGWWRWWRSWSGPGSGPGQRWVGVVLMIVLVGGEIVWVVVDLR